MRQWFAGLLVLLWSVAPLGAETITRMLPGATTTVLNTELNGVVNNGLSAVGPIKDNRPGGAIGTEPGEGYVFADLEGTFTFGGNPLAGSGIGVWFVKSIDETNYPDCGLGNPTAFFQVRTSAATSRVIVYNVQVPIGLYKVCAQNAGTGQALAGGGVNTIKVQYLTPKGS